ncbi:MAG: hypothetical protein ACPG9D_07865, partial [Candidatus Poseidoniaceae archaeon]
STTEQTTYAGIDSPSVIAASQIDALENGTIGYYVVMETNSMDAPPASMDYLQIIATNDFFVNLDTSTLFTAGEILRANVRVYGYRATADSSTYAALVQSELLSS